MVGEVLGGYRVLSELGSGGMGSVYRAQHALLGKPAAVKMLRSELTANAELLERFINEARAATSISHPGIVDVYDFGYTDDGRAYIVMELLDGEPLGERIRRLGRLSEVETEKIGRQIAAAMRAAHAKGIVHRDLKPDNVFLVPDGGGSGDRAKVLDFGVAKQVDLSSTSVRRTRTGALMGTPLYMAPEQAREASTIDHRADLYSLGCILYEMLVGQPPFLAEGAGEIIALQLFAEPEPPSKRLSSLNPMLEAIVLRLLAKEPADRYQDAFEVHNALNALTGALSTKLAELSVGETKRFTMSMSQGITAPLPPAIPPTPRPSADRSLRLSLVDPSQHAAPKQSSTMPIVAALITVALACGIGIFVMTRDSGAEPAKPPVAEPIATPPKAVAPPSVVVPAPAPDEIQVIEEPPDETKPKRPRSLKGETPKTVKHDGLVTAPERTTHPTPCRSPDGSPCEFDVGELPKVKKP